MNQFRTVKLCPAIALGLFLQGVVQAQQPTTPAPEPAASPANPPASDTAAKPASEEEKVDKRVLGVLPNYRTAPKSAESKPLTARQKFTIAAKDSFDWPVYLVSAGFAGLYQLEDENPSFGQGLKGYAHRYGTSYGDQTIGNMMTEAIWPSLLREDPRYFQQLTGGVWHRAIYAASRVVITRTDAGGHRFNFSEWLGNGSTAAIGSLYYPQGRGASDIWQRTYTQVATDAFSQELKEFWPDIKRHLTHKHNGQNAENTDGGH